MQGVEHLTDLCIHEATQAEVGCGRRAVLMCVVEVAGGGCHEVLHPRVRLVASAGIAFGCWHFIDAIQREEFLGRHERKMGGDEADEKHPGCRVGALAGCAEPLARKPTDVAVVTCVLAFAGSRFSDHAAWSDRGDEIGKLLPYG